MFADLSGQLHALQLATMKLCRKQGNLKLAEKLLLEELGNMSVLGASGEGEDLLTAARAVRGTMDPVKLIK